MSNIIRKEKDILFHAIPIIIAITISGIIDVQISLFSPLTKFLNEHLTNENLKIALQRLLWSIIQIIPAFLFGLYSDHHHRKKAFIISQIIGFISVIILLYWGVGIWSFIIIGLTFNPLSISRAALLDNYPQVSPVRIIAWTFIARNISWLFIDKYTKDFLDVLLIILICVFFINIIFSWVFFKDRYDTKERFKKLEHKSNDNLIKTNKKPIVLALIGMAFAETTFYLLWIFLESDHHLEKWLSVTTLGTFFGITLTLFYNHKKADAKKRFIIPLFYAIGAGMISVMLYYCVRFCFPIKINLICYMAGYCVIGGVYLPFISDYLIEASGSERKAVGAVFSELGDMISLFLASIFSIIIGSGAFQLAICMISTLGIATILQVLSERKVVYRQSNLV